MAELFDYQAKAYQTWKDNGFWGLVQASTGAGKTKLGADCVKHFLSEYPDKKVLIATSSKDVGIKSWMTEVSHALNIEPSITGNKVIHIGNVTIMTYQMAVNKMYRGGLTCDCLIADECQHLATPAHGQVMKMEPTAVLGLSATPEESQAILGAPMYSIGVDQANICPFTVHMVKFKPTESEMDKYNKATKSMEERAFSLTKKVCPTCGGHGLIYNGPDNVDDCLTCKATGWMGKTNLPPGRDRLYDFLAIKRREVCYHFQSRIPITTQLVMQNEGRRIVIYTERTKDAHTIEKELLSHGIPCSMYVKDKNTLSDFEEHKTNVLIMVKSLREGWDDPSLSVCIMNSLSIGTKILTQTMGRTMRKDPNNPHKHADNYLLIADGTSDINARSALKYPSSYFKEVQWNKPKEDVRVHDALDKWM